MNNQTFENLNLFLNHYYKDIKQLKIIDVGSIIRTPAKIRKLESIFANHNYIGVDIVEGKNVDVVLDDPYVYPFKDEEIDVVIANNIFEHSEHFWILYLELIRILKPNGILYTNSPSNGDFHRGPFNQDSLIDAWRFYPDSGKALQNWAKKNNFEELILLESYTYKRRDSSWNDYIAIFLKDKKYLKSFPNRIVDNINHFYNGFKYNDNNPLNFQVKTEDHILLEKTLRFVIRKYLIKFKALMKKIIKKLLNYFYVD